jgi:hypothetical protein
MSAPQLVTASKAVSHARNLEAEHAKEEELDAAPSQAIQGRRYSREDARVACPNLHALENEFLAGETPSEKCKTLVRILQKFELNVDKLPARTEVRLKAREFTQVFSDELDLESISFNPSYDIGVIWNIVFVCLNVLCCCTPQLCCKRASLKDMVFRDFLKAFPEVPALNCLNCDLTDFDLEILENNPKLKLMMLGRAIPGNFITSQMKHTNTYYNYNICEHFNNGVCKFTDEGVESLSTLQNLQHLYIDASATTGNALASVAGMHKLETLFLANPFTEREPGGVIKKSDCTFLSKLKMLKHLYTMYGALCNEQLMEVAKLNQLQSLGFSCEKEVRLFLLQNFALQTLAVCHHGLLDEDVAALKAFTGLKNLCLVNCEDSTTTITREGLKTFKHLNTLESAVVGFGKNTLQFADYISSSHKLRHLVLLQTAKEDFDPESFICLKHLDKLETFAVLLNSETVSPLFAQNLSHLRNVRSFAINSRILDEDSNSLGDMSSLEALEVVVGKDNDLVANWLDTLQNLKKLKSIRLLVSFETAPIIPTADNNLDTASANSEPDRAKPEGAAKVQPITREQILSGLEMQVKLLKDALDGVEITLVKDWNILAPSSQKRAEFAWDLPKFFKQLTR